MYVPFTGLGLRKGYRGDTWLKNRIEIFKRFTLESLLEQTNKNFTLWISWRREDRYNPIVEEFAGFLEKTPLDVIFTYGGVMFWDDKQENDNLISRFQATLPLLKDEVGDAEYVFMTIQPSDDMYLPHAVEDIQAWHGTEMAYGYTRGYIMNYATKEIAEYNPTTLPPFYTIRFPAETFLSPVKHFAYIKGYKSHEYVEELGIVKNPNRSFVVGTHGENISTTYQHPYKGRVLSSAERDSILILTGTFHSEPFVSRHGARLKLRTVFNRIPFNEHIRTLYHKLPAKVQLL